MFYFHVKQCLETKLNYEENIFKFSLVHDMAFRLGLNLFNADICISNTNISNKKYRYLYFYVIRDICNLNADICI